MDFEGNLETTEEGIVFGWKRLDVDSGEDTTDQYNYDLLITWNDKNNQVILINFIKFLIVLISICMIIAKLKVLLTFA